jgi:hypothetical protein
MTTMPTDDTDDSKTNDEVWSEWLNEAEAEIGKQKTVNEVLRAGVYAMLVTLNEIEKANVTQDPLIFNLVKAGRRTARETLKEAAQPAAESED